MVDFQRLEKFVELYISFKKWKVTICNKKSFDKYFIILCDREVFFLFIYPCALLRDNVTPTPHLKKISNFIPIINRNSVKGSMLNQIVFYNIYVCL